MPANQWNQPRPFNNTQQPYPSIYLRNYINDEGQTPGDASVNMQADRFTAAAGQLLFNLSMAPNNLYPVFVYQNQKLKNPLVDYNQNVRTIQFAAGVVQTGDSIEFFYWIPLS